MVSITIAAYSDSADIFKIKVPFQEIMHDANTQTAPLENLVGPRVIFDDGVKYLGPGLHCITIEYAGAGRGQLNLAYNDVAAVFRDGIPDWQNMNYSAVNPATKQGIEIVLAPGTLYHSLKGRTLRFQRPGDDKKKDYLKIIADEVNEVYQEGLLRYHRLSD